METKIRRVSSIRVSLFLHLHPSSIGCDDSAAEQAYWFLYAPASPLNNENFNKNNKIILFRIYIYEYMSGTSMENLKYVFK